jgi:hypothetical protein
VNPNHIGILGFFLGRHAHQATALTAPDVKPAFIGNIYGPLDRAIEGDSIHFQRAGRRSSLRKCIPSLFSTPLEHPLTPRANPWGPNPWNAGTPVWERVLAFGWWPRHFPASVEGGENMTANGHSAY